MSNIDAIIIQNTEKLNIPKSTEECLFQLNWIAMFWSDNYILLRQAMQWTWHTSILSDGSHEIENVCKVNLMKRRQTGTLSILT